jgi:hypothetical protein
LSPGAEAAVFLASLRERNLLSSEDPRAQAEYFAELGIIVRRFLDRQYGTQVLDATLREFKQRIRKAEGLSPEDRDAALRFVNDTEFVKFAKNRLSSEEALAWDKWAEELFLNSTPRIPNA